MIPRSIPALILCLGCNNEIDPELCRCGDGEHGPGVGHPFTPAGCTCHELTSAAGRYVRDVRKVGPWVR